MNADEFFSLVDKYKKKKKQAGVDEIATIALPTATKASQVKSSLRDIAPVAGTGKAVNDLILGNVPVYRQKGEDGSTKNAKKLESLLTVTGKEDFGNKSGYVSTKAEGFWDKLSSKYGMGYTDLQYEYINNKNGIRDEISRKALSWGSDNGKTTTFYEEKALDYITDEEIAVYNYYYQTEGKEKAQEFLDALAETLSARKAGREFSTLQGRTAAEILYGVEAGQHQFEQGVKNLGNMIVGKDNYIPQTSTQILTGMVREDLADDGFEVLGNSIGQVAFDAVTTGSNMLPSVAVGAVNPVAGAVLMGGTAAGNAYQQALNEGHDKAKARTYATAIGVLEGSLQYALGGIGKLGGTSATISRSVSGIKNGALRFSLEYGGKIASEAFEEGLQEVLDPLVKNAVIGTDESVDWEDVTYSALLGGLMGGTFGAAEVSSSHLTNAETAVVNKEFNNRVAEAEQNGKKLSNSQKNKLYESVIKEMEKGYISTDTIESVLGGETYKSYRDTVDSEDALQKEFDVLNKMKQGEMTGEQIDRRNELKQQLADLKNTSQRDQLKTQLSEEVFSRVKDSRLAESYNERTRRSQAFEADISQYDEKARETVQRAIDSGILNNTNRTHEFVDLIARISADKGVPFDFANNAKLKESGFALEGVTVNGYVNQNGITINVDSAKALNSVVGHEVAHVLEGTELYDALREAVFNYAIAKDGVESFNKRLKSLEALYKGMENTTPEAELAADLIGDYLFADADFVRKLSTEHRNIFEKIFDEIKYLCKVATAGTKEARQLEKVKKLFEEAYRTETKNPTAEGGTRYSLIIKHTDGTTEVLTDARDLTNEQAVNYLQQAKSGKLQGKSYIPVRKDTPQVIIDTLEQVNEKVENRSLVMQVRKAQQAMTASKSGRRAGKYGSNVRGHALSAEQIVEIVNNLDDPKMVIYQTNRHDMNGKPLPNNVAVFVEYSNNGAEGVAVIEFDSAIDPEFVGAEYGDTGYHAVVTVFQPDVERDGMAFDYAEELLSNSDNIELKIERRQSEGSATQANQPNTSNELPYNNSIRNEGEKVNSKKSLSSENDIAPLPGGIYGKDVALEFPLPPGYVEQSQVATGKEHISLEDYANQESPVWRNVAYDDDATKLSIMQQTHEAMVAEGAVVTVPETVTENVAQSFPDLRNMKKKERNPILKNAMTRLKTDLRQFLNGFKNQGFEFEVNDKVLDATLYNTGINEVLEKVTKEKASMLYSTEEIFRNARYLYSTPDYAGDPNVYRWNYFYTPVQIGTETVGVRIAVRDMVKGTDGATSESQIYNWGIKKDASLGGGSHGQKAASSGASSDASNNSIPQTEPGVNKDVESVEPRATRKELHQGIVDRVKAKFTEKGLDLDAVLKKAKNLSTFATVDNTPQRVMEKALGYKEGQLLSDLTVNQVAQNETEGIKWLNSFTDRKNGLLAKISKQYNIKPGSDESAAAQMYAEGFYVDDNNNIVQYGDVELAKDFPDTRVQSNIKGLARDPRIRRIYDETLEKINASRSRNAYPEIPRLDNYFLHFRAMEDTFSRLGLPFNPNDIRAKDLPTDLNGVTADLKPGQPYFASAMHRKGKRTSFDLLGGLERYLASAKNQIYHIDDIQTLRALRNYIADTYGQANGLEGLDALSEEEAQERIEKVYNSHLSTFAKFLNEEANVLAGKTALIDRGLEGIIGRRGITFLDTVNKQVGSNMVGLNVSSSLTNFLPVAQTFAKTNKGDFVKAFGQTVANKVSSIFGRNDGFAESSPVIIRRKGADRFYRKLYQKAGDAGYVLMSAVDDISTELIARTKYNELTRKGMDAQQAHFETDKWVSRLMGDRSLGQQPQLYNSKMLGLVTKFQLEVRNQLDSQFYDTIQEVKASNEEIQNGLLRNAKTAAKVTSTFVQLAVVQHLFGKVFESIAGYNPAFDIIDVLIKTFGWDDEEDDEDTVLDNIEEGFLALLEDLPYTSTFTGGRIPISSALPVKELVTGKDQYGNEKSRLETLGEVAPYYILPTGYGQLKKSAQGISMFSDEFPLAGSYTKPTEDNPNGKLRFPVEDTAGNWLQATLFGQWASENARNYFDNGRKPLEEKQIQEFKDLDIPIEDYWEYRENLSQLDSLEEKLGYISTLDLPIAKKNILANNLTDRKEPIDMAEYGDKSGLADFNYSKTNANLHSILQEHGISDEEYEAFDDDTKDAYKWAAKNPEKYTVSKAISGDLVVYRQYTSDLSSIKADKDANGKAVSGSRKEKVIDYINGLDADYGEKIILYKSEYPSDDRYNRDIIDYLNSRDDVSYAEMETILTELGFEVLADGTVRWG